MDINEFQIKNEFSSAMGATINVHGPERSMYLVIGRDSRLVSLVRSCGGEIVYQISNNKMLATLSFTGYLALRNNTQVSHIGPVTVDQNRLTKVINQLANTTPENDPAT